ncbi:cobalamin biosynthesis protein [Streptomyces orinoci]|uniref:Cobalamin biosynthesis protein n=1 Tax=Streptomyces orinoci TaxID=67339 RepID=A0ABV3JWW7_STRON|nr:cobalamin biosynthesis protein [Streptomyces orinoci]
MQHSPLRLHLGIGARRGVTAEEVLDLVRRTLADAGPGVIAALATAEGKAGEPGLRSAAAELGVPVRAYPAAELDSVAVPHPSATARAAVGTGSVAEAAALRSAGAGAVLVVGKRKSPRATCAIAREPG